MKASAKPYVDFEIVDKSTIRKTVCEGRWEDYKEELVPIKSCTKGQLIKAIENLYPEPEPEECDDYGVYGDRDYDDDDEVEGFAERD